MVCPHQYEHISSDKFLCHNNEGRSYGPGCKGAQNQKVTRYTIFGKFQAKDGHIYSSKFEFLKNLQPPCNNNTWKCVAIPSGTASTSTTKMVHTRGFNSLKESGSLQNAYIPGRAVKCMMSPNFAMTNIGHRRWLEHHL